MAALSSYHASQKSAYQKKGSGSRSGRAAERYAHAFVDGIDQLIRFAGAKVTAPGQTCSQMGTTGQAGGKVWKSTSGHRESGEDAIGCSHGVSEGRTDFTCIDCVAPLACRLATYWQEGGA